MEKYVVTCFNNQQINEGISWLASLNEIAKYDGKILIIDMGGIEKSVAHLDSRCKIIPVISKYNIPEVDCFCTIAEFSKTNPGIFAYWGCDAYFQNSIDSIFDIAADHLTFCCDRHPAGFAPQIPQIGEIVSNRLVKTHQAILHKVASLHGSTIHTGFIAGPSPVWDAWMKFHEFIIKSKIMKSKLGCEKMSLNSFILCFNKLVKRIDDNWNHQISGELKWKDDYFVSKGNRINVLHVDSVMKSIEGRSYLFSERYPILHREWDAKLKGNSTSAISLLKKTSKRLIKR